MRGKSLFPCADRFVPGLTIASIRTFILDGNTDYTVTAQDWPAFCYANNNCNLDNIQDGLFRGPLLVKVCYVVHDIFSAITNQSPAHFVGIQVSTDVSVIGE